MVFTDIKATGPNAYGKAAFLAETKASVDMAQTSFHIRRSNSEVLNAPQRMARDHFRDYEPVQSNAATQRYFTCEQDGPTAQPFSRLLKPKTVQQLDQWQVFGNATPQMKADVCAVLRTVEMQYSSMPTYFSMLKYVGIELYCISTVRRTAQTSAFICGVALPNTCHWSSCCTVLGFSRREKGWAVGPSCSHVKYRCVAALLCTG